MMQDKKSNIFVLKYFRIFVLVCATCNYFSLFGYDIGDFESRTSLGSTLATSSDEVALSLTPVVSLRSNVLSGSLKHSRQSSFSIVAEVDRDGIIPLYSMVSIASPSRIEGLIDKDSTFKQSSVLLLGKLDIGSDFYFINVGAFSRAKLNYDTVMVSFPESDTPEKISYLSTVSDTGLVLNMPLVIIPNRFYLATQVWGWHRTGIASSPDSYDKSDINRKFNRGLMWGLDISASVSISDFWMPTLTVAAENLSTGCYKNWLGKYPGKKICGATMIKSDVRDENSEQVVDPTNLKVGVGITPRLSKRVALGIHAALDNIHLITGDRYYHNPKKKSLISTGVELLFGNPFKDTPFKMGVAVNTDSFSVAASFVSEIFSLRLAYISEQRYVYIPYSLYYDSDDVETSSNLISKYVIGIKFRSF